MSSGDEPNPQDEYRDVPEERNTIGRGREALRERLQQAAQRKQQVTIRLDADIVERFKQLAGPDGSYQTLINRALHEWLEAQSVGGLLRAELEELRALVRALKPDDGSHASSV